MTTSSRDVVIRHLDDPAELRSASRLYREVFGYVDPVDGVSPRLLAALAHNGGSVVGAFAGGELVGFAYGFPGVDAAGAPYHYSQAAVVSRRAQGSGVGRSLKRAQAEVARERGARSMRWAFDPVQSRNAHFNLDVLGARGRWLELDLYGPGTDRMVVEWDLDPAAEPSRPDDEVTAPAPPPEWGDVALDDGGAWLAVPAAFDELDGERADGVRKRVRVGIEDLLASGLVATGCARLDATTSAYRFTRFADGAAR